MKIAITGGAGFIGSVLAKRLKDDGHELVLIDLKKSEIFPDDSVIADIRDKEALTKALKGTGAIYHLAATMSRRSRSTQTLMSPAARM